MSFQLQFVDEDQEQHLGSCINLNVGGMFLSTEILYPVDTKLSVEFNLPGQNGSMVSPVRVAWVNHPEWRKKNDMPCGMGLQFLEMSTVFRDVLKDYINSLSIEED